MNWQIAIDGPAAAGKSTIAKILAQKFGFEYLDTGAMYRAATIKALSLGIDLDDESKYDFITNTAIDFIDNKIHLDGKDVSSEIRSLEVSNNVSVVCKYKIVRDRMVELQQKIAASKNIVMDGRDIGTVVLPKATIKIFLVATPEERARRRMQERIVNGTNTQTLEETIKEICERDYKDSHRDIAPLKRADDAIEIDSSQLSINEVVDTITRIVTERGWNMEDVKVVNEVAEEATKEESQEAAAAEAAQNNAAENAQNPSEIKELQVVEGTVVKVLEAEPELKNKKGEVVKKAKDARVVVQLDNGPEGYLFIKDVAGVQDEEDLFMEFIEGDRVRLVVKKVYPDGGKVLLSATLIEKRENLKSYQTIIDNHGIITAKVIRSISVGLVLDHEGYSCLLPTSQLNIPQEKLTEIVGQEIVVAPIRVDYNRIRLIVSQKVADAIIEKKEKTGFLDTIKIGDIFDGIVKNIEDYGAFIEIGKGIEGLLHISELEHNKLVKVEKIMKPGDTVKVQVIKIHKDHIGLSRKALLPNHWQTFIDKTKVGDLVTGNIEEINDSGIVVLVDGKVQAFLPKSEISWDREMSNAINFTIGQEVTLTIIEINTIKKRVILSKKQLTPNPWEVMSLKVGDEVSCQVIQEINEGVKLLVEGASAFMPKSFFGTKTTFTPGEEFTAKVKVFDNSKHKLIISLKEEQPNQARPAKPNYERNNYNNNNYNNYNNRSNNNNNSNNKQEKISGTFADFINLDDFK